MAIDIKVPAAGESITSANIAKWYKNSGDFVKKGEALVSLETDKVSNELEAEADGILTVSVGEGEEVSIGTVIGQIAPAAESSAPVAVASQVAPAPATAQGAAASSGAAVEIVVPAAGESITSANVAAWRKKDGDYCEKGEILVTLETDKVSTELEAPVSGTLQILVHEGEVSIGKVIGMIAPSHASATAAPAPKPVSAPVVAPAAVAVVSESRPKPDLSVLSAPKPAAAPAAVTEDGRTTRRKMSMLRRKIATHLVNAQQTAAILTTFNEVDMTAVMELRKSVQDDFLKKHGVKLGFMSFFVKAVTQALALMETTSSKTISMISVSPSVRRRV